jgi:hypothetical protein
MTTSQIVSMSHLKTQREIGTCLPSLHAHAFLKNWKSTRHVPTPQSYIQMPSKSVRRKVCAYLPCLQII